MLIAERALPSASIRLVSYNILANGYASSTHAEDRMYPFCPAEYLRNDYRKPLVLRELLGEHRPTSTTTRRMPFTRRLCLGYRADIISLQECDTSFYERELTLVMESHGYRGQMKVKSENVREGEVIFYRTDRFE
jgi:2',5'-phosphodiesterase